MKKFIYNTLLILLPINILAYYYLFTHREEIIEIRNDKIIRDTVIKILPQYINPDSILFVTVENTELKIEPNIDSPTKSNLRMNSIFYIVQKEDEPDQIQIKRKTVEDFWYQVNDYKGVSGWVFGYNTSKSLKLRRVIK